VLDVHEIPGALDLVIGVAGIDCRVELKDGSRPPSRRALTAAEVDVLESWRGMPPAVVTSVEEAEILVRNLRRYRLVM
jgi:hypothetical protein